MRITATRLKSFCHGQHETDDTSFFFFFFYISGVCTDKKTTAIIKSNSKSYMYKIAVCQELVENGWNFSVLFLTFPALRVYERYFVREA